MSNLGETEIDCVLNDNAVCPYCGHVHLDSWKIAGGEEGESEFECEDCGESMIVARVVDIKYTTYKGNP